MSVVCIVASRMNSSRFPGKVLNPLMGRPVIEHVLERCSRIRGVDRVVMATFIAPANLSLILFCQEKGYPTFVIAQDDENNVLQRYRWCALDHNATIILRVTHDCPLIDPEICHKVLKKLEYGYPFAANDYPIQTYAKGLGCEAFTFETLDTAYRSATDPYDLEHVSPWMQRHLRCGTVYNDKDESHLNYCVDYPEDIARLENIMRGQNARSLAG